MTDPRMIYSMLKTNPSIHEISKIQRSLVDNTVIGFHAHTNSNLGKRDKLQVITDWCVVNNLEVEVYDEEGHLTRFRIMIKK